MLKYEVSIGFWHYLPDTTYINFLQLVYLHTDQIQPQKNAVHRPQMTSKLSCSTELNYEKNNIFR